MCRVLFTLFLALLMPLPAAWPAGAFARADSGRAADSLRTTIVAHHIRLTLTLPGRTFPADALVRVTVTARTTSRHRIWLLGSGPMTPGKSVPQVEVVRDGAVVYPPALSRWIPQPGPPPTGLPVDPGKTIRTTTYIILRGPLVRAAVDIVKGQFDLGRSVKVTTPPLSVTLTAPDPPTVMVTATPGGPQAEIAPPAGTVRKPLYEAATMCSGTIGGAQTLDWTRADSDIFTPACAPMEQWHLVAGWPGHTVITVDLPLSESRRPARGRAQQHYNKSPPALG